MKIGRITRFYTTSRSSIWDYDSFFWAPRSRSWVSRSWSFAEEPEIGGPHRYMDYLGRYNHLLTLFWGLSSCTSLFFFRHLQKLDQILILSPFSSIFHLIPPIFLHKILRIVISLQIWVYYNSIWNIKFVFWILKFIFCFTFWILQFEIQHLHQATFVDCVFWNWKWKRE